MCLSCGFSGRTDRTRDTAGAGHDHVARAFEAGASAAVVSRERAHQLAALGPVFAVEDTLKAMERLGIAARARSKAKIVAVQARIKAALERERSANIPVRLSAKRERPFEYDRG